MKQITGTVIPWERLPRSKIMVLKGQGVHYAGPSRMSDYKSYVPLASVTAHQAAGATLDEYDDPTKNL